MQSWLVLAVFCLDTNNKMPHVAREGTTEQTTLTYSELLVMVISKTLPLLDSSVPWVLDWKQYPCWEDT